MTTMVTDIERANAAIERENNAPTHAGAGAQAHEVWRWGDDGLFKRDKNGAEFQVFTSPIEPVKVLTTLDGHMTLETKITVAGRQRTAFLDDRFPSIRTSDAGAELAAFGIPVDVKEVRALQTFVAYILRSDKLPTGQAFDRLGWHETVLLVPGLTDSIFIPPSGGDWLKAYGETNGSESDAKISYKNYLSDAVYGAPTVFAILGAPLASPLLKFLPQTEFISFLLHMHTVSTGLGKTTLLQLAKAAVGSPPKIDTTWDGTKVGFEMILGSLQHMPLFLDELGDAKFGTPEQFVMMLAEESGRRRGTSGGGLRPTRTWRLIALSTGNAPIAPGSSHHARRIISIPVALPNDKFADATLQLSNDFYGWPLRWVLPLYQHQTVQHIKEIARTFTDLYQGDLLALKSQANYWAVLETGAEMLLTALKLPPQWGHEALYEVAKASVERKQAEGINYLSRFIDAITEDMASDPAGWGLDLVNKRAPRGTRGKVIDEVNLTVAVLPGVATELARKACIPDLTGVMQEAKEKEVLFPATDGHHLQRLVRFQGGTPTRAWVLRIKQEEPEDV